MAHNFLSPPYKRTLMSDVTSPSADLTTSKRPKQNQNQNQQQTPLPIPPGHASLRILCHASHIGGFIGKSGTSIKQLQQTTSSKIRVLNDSSSLSPDSVILLVAPSLPFKKLKLGEVTYEDDVSALQEAAVRVYEKILEVSTEGGGSNNTCRVLIEAGQAGAVIGKGGKMVEKLRRESGAKIRVLCGDNLPSNVPSSLELVEIEGDVLAVKKGLLGVCSRLQQCPQAENSSIKESKPVESTSQPAVIDYRVDYPLQRMPLSVASTSSSPAVVARPLSFEVDRPVSIEPKPQQQEVVFKILCSNDRVGGVIGKGGSIIHALEEESGASISVGPNVNSCDERLVTITSKEDADARYSPAQRAVVLVFSRSAEAGAQKGVDTGSNKGSSVSARLVVPSNQVGCLLGKGGAIVAEMRKATGAQIRILRGEPVPKCVSEDDQVVEITGPFVKIQDALYQVTGKLRTNIFPSKVMNAPTTESSPSMISDTQTSFLGRAKDPITVGGYQSFGTSRSFDELATMRRVSDPSSYSYRLDHSPSAGYRISEVDGQTKIRPALDPLLRSHRLDHSPSAGYRISEIDGQTNVRPALDPLLRPHRLDHSPSAGYRTSEVASQVNSRSFVNHARGLANGGTELSSINRPTIITTTTVEMLVPESAINSVYGENGRNLMRIREISRAKVDVHEASPGTRDRTVVISGSPDETQAAQSLLHAFILTGS